ncbi:MAG: hypothetical protein DRJ41_01890 [Thermoprotei archaeon]|nr:MAG: hypothetical protein DRJ41_01890 [Thermoprotei archaeon]
MDLREFVDKWFKETERELTERLIEKRKKILKIVDNILNGLKSIEMFKDVDIALTDEFEHKQRYSAEYISSIDRLRWMLQELSQTLKPGKYKMLLLLKRVEEYDE